MPNRSRDKGSRAERGIVELLRSYGLDAYRIPLSGASNGFKSDVEVRLAGATLKLESKARKSAFKQLTKWLDGSDALVVKADRGNSMVVMDLRRFARLIATIPHNQAEKPGSKPSPDPVSSYPDIEPQPATIYNDIQAKPINSEIVRINPASVAPVRGSERDEADQREAERRLRLGIR